MSTRTSSNEVISKDIFHKGTILQIQNDTKRKTVNHNKCPDLM
jgi:hypothetical protein